MQVIEATKPDLGTPQLKKRHVTVTEETSEVRKRRRVLSGIPIDFYFHRGWISQRQKDAADELYRLWYYGAEKSSYVTVRNPHMPKGSAMDFETREMLERKYNNAIRAPKGLLRQLVVYNVVCVGEWAAYIQDTIEKVGVNRRMKVLREALDDIADHFKYPHEPKKRSEKDRKKKHLAEAVSRTYAFRQD